MKTPIHDIQAEHHEWEQANFPDKKPHQPVFGMVEEVGELCHALLKSEQCIRGDAEKHQADAKDAIGDVFIYMLSFCTMNGWSFTEIAEETWEQVKARDWKRNPESGSSG